MVIGDPGITGLLARKHAIVVSKEEPACAIILPQTMVELNVTAVLIHIVPSISLMVHLNTKKLVIAIKSLVQVEIH